MSKKLDLRDVNRCLLCVDPACERIADQRVQAAQRIRALRFADHYRALADFDYDEFAPYLQECEDRCILKDHGGPVNIRGIFKNLQEMQDELEQADIEPDLSSNICGIPLENPFLLSSSVVSSTYEMIARAFDMGWAGASTKTICNYPQHNASPRFSALKDDYGSFYGFKNIEQLSDHNLIENIGMISRLKKEYPNKVIIASIMGREVKEWTRLANACDEAGADAIELNFSCPHMEDEFAGKTVGQSESLVYRYTQACRMGTKKPLIVKLTPNVEDMIPFAIAAKMAGCDGIAAINTILSITNVNLETLSPEPAIRGKSSLGGYSGTAIRPIALRFISDLSGCKELDGLHLTAMGGVENWEDALEFLLLGAGSVQITTAVMQYGYRIIDDLIFGLKGYMKERNIASLSQIVGAAAGNIVSIDSLEMDSLLLPKFEQAKCLGCGRCYLSCRDGGHQAIRLGNDRRPILDGKKCVGCHLCVLVCPERAISSGGKRIRKKN